MLTWIQSIAGLQYLEGDRKNEPKECQDISEMEASIPPSPPKIQYNAVNNGKDEGHLSSSQATSCEEVLRSPRWLEFSVVTCTSNSY